MARNPGSLPRILLAIAISGLTIALFFLPDGAGAANILALPVGVGAMYLAYLAVSPQGDGQLNLDRLAFATGRHLGQIRQNSLGMSGDAAPADVHFRGPDDRSEASIHRQRPDGRRTQGSLSGVLAFYRSLERGRLVVLGDPGAGKTLLVTQFALELLKLRASGAEAPVPVLLPLSSLDLGDVSVLAGTPSDLLAERFDAWVADRLVQDYGLHRPAARDLVRTNRVLALLDASDQLDRAVGSRPTAATAEERFPRSTALARALNHGDGRRPVVLVCSLEVYAELATAARGTSDREAVLQDATTIILEPLTADAVVDHLVVHFPNRERGERLERRWRAVERALLFERDSRRIRELSELLSHPWLLNLAVTIYQDPATDPSELLTRTALQLRGDLVDGLVAAVTRRHPRPDHRFYPSADVTRWLSVLARQESGSDFYLHELWRLGGYATSVKVVTTGIIMTVLAVSYAGAWSMWALATHHAMPQTVPARTAMATALLLVVFVATKAGFTGPGLMPRLAFDQETSWGMRVKALRLGNWIVTGAGAGTFVGIGMARLSGATAVVSSGVVMGVIGGFAVGVVGGFLEVVAADVTSSTRPTSLRRQNVTYCLCLTSLACSGLAGALSILTAASAGPRTGPLGTGSTLQGSALGATLGLALGLSAAFLLGLGAWTRAGVGLALASRRNLIAPRAGDFVDWAHRAGLLQLSGTAFRFRDDELRQRLAMKQTPSCGPGSRPDRG